MRAVWDVGPTCLVGTGQTIGRGCACAQTHLGRGWLGGAALAGAVTSASLVISERKTLWIVYSPSPSCFITVRFCLLRGIKLLLLVRLFMLTHLSHFSPYAVSLVMQICTVRLYAYSSLMGRWSTLDPTISAYRHRQAMYSSPAISCVVTLRHPCCLSITHPSVSSSATCAGSGVSKPSV